MQHRPPSLRPLETWEIRAEFARQLSVKYGQEVRPVRRWSRVPGHVAEHLGLTGRLDLGDTAPEGPPV